jgi:hypothetical protein
MLTPRRILLVNTGVTASHFAYRCHGVCAQQSIKVRGWSQRLVTADLGWSALSDICACLCLLVWPTRTHRLRAHGVLPIIRALADLDDLASFGLYLPCSLVSHWIMSAPLVPPYVVTCACSCFRHLISRRGPADISFQRCSPILDPCSSANYPVLYA